MDLNAKIAIVTGASSGIGAAFCKALIDKGATVYGLARSKDKLKRIQSELGEAFVPVVVDVTDHDAISNWIKQNFGEERQPDVLINNAGVGYFADVDKLPLSEWHTMVNTNLTGIFYMTRLLVPLMKQNSRTCHIINIASIAGKIGNPDMSGYNASKFGVRGFSESLFKELRYDGIKVTCFYPGSIATGFFDNAKGVEVHPNMMQPADVSKTLIDVLETADNFLINEITMRPLNPKPPEE